MRTRLKTVYNNNEDFELKEETLTSTKLRISISKLKQKMDSISHEIDLLNKFVSDKKCIKIFYEDFADMNNTMNKIFDFLNVSVTTLFFENEVKNTDIKGLIENYDEVESWLKQNNYAEFL